MSAAEVKELREQRGQLYAQMQDLYKVAATEKRALSTEEKTKFDTLDQSQENLKGRIDTAEKMERLALETATRTEQRDRDDHDAKKRDKPTSQDVDVAFRGWAMGRERGPEHIEAAKKLGLNPYAANFDLRLLSKAPKTVAELNQHILTRSATDTQVVGDSTLGGNVRANEPMAAIERALLEYGGMREVSRVIRTQTGGNLPMPTANDTGNAAVIVGETSAIDQANVQFGQTVLGAFKYSSQIVRASVEFMQDASFDFGEWLGGALGERVARGTNSHFTAGTGTTQPFGAATQALASTQQQISYDGLVLLQHRLDPAYRKRGAVWMFHDSVLRRIKRLVDSQGLPLWSAGLAAGEPDTILGHGYVINQACATDGTASTGKLVLFGAFNSYIVRDVMDLQLKRLEERYAERGEVAFFTLSRHDGVTLIASTATPPIVALVPTT
jgi:HK97 family phage major capsid protein